jgi:hypothetical protein
MIVNKVDVNKNSLKTILLFFTASPLMRNTVNDFFIPLERVIRLPLQNSANTRELGGRSTARKSPIGSTNNQ